jgi:hypothetical protein
VDYNYCPACDKTVYEEKWHCVGCKNLVIKFSEKTEFTLWVVLTLIFIAVISLFVAIGLTPDWGAFLAGMLFFFITFGMAMEYARRMGNRLKKKARNLYDENKERYKNGEKLDFRVKVIKAKKPPWNVRHIKFLYRSTILSCGLIPIIAMIIWYFRTLTFCASFTMTSLIIISVFSYLAYKPASRFVSIIEAMELSSEEFSFPKWRTMKVDSQRFGMFFVFYDSRYKLWVTTGKHVDRERKRNYIIWKKPRPIKRFLGREDRLPDYLSASRLRGIKSLQAIRFEKLKHGNRIAAILNDKWFYSEDRDILEALEVLWEIEARI